MSTNEKLTIIIVEDDACVRDSLIKCIKHTEDMSVIAVADDSKQAFHDISHHFPHVIILDLELQDGSGSGLLLLKDLEGLREHYKPFILIVTHNSSPLIQDAARSYGADYIISKHQNDYSEQFVIDFIRLMKDGILRRFSGSSVNRLKEDAAREKEKATLEQLKSDFHRLGVPVKSKGYHYLIDAILLAKGAKANRFSSALSERYNKTPASIDRAMQTAISHAWKTTEIDCLLTHYKAHIDPERGVPTVSEFIHYFADKYRSE